MSWLLSLLGAIVPAFIKGWFTKDAGKETGRLEVQVQEQAEVLKNVQDSQSIDSAVDHLSDDDAASLSDALNKR